MNNVLSAIDALETAVSDLKSDRSLSFEQIVQISTLVKQVEQMLPAWRLECARFAKVSTPVADPVEPEYVAQSEEI